MRLRIRHCFGVVSLVSGNVPTEESDLTMKDAFYAMFESVVNQCPRRDTLLVLGDFNASTGNDRDGYETCVGPRGSGTVNQNNTKFLDFARSYGLRVAGSWFRTHKLIAGLGIPTLVVWQSRLTMCSLMAFEG